VLDTNILISYWKRVTGNNRLSAVTTEQAREWGHSLVKELDSDLILTPVCIEFLCGFGSAHEVKLGRAYLPAFDIADEGSISERDWQQARRLAERVPRDGLRRQLGDCLIRAICDRLRLEVLTGERRFPR
jgi:predicted nucleic acid-binding protein